MLPRRAVKTDASALVVALIAGCGASPVAPVDNAPVLDVRNGNVAYVDTGLVPVAVTWGSPTSTPGCFFFSGPLDLGRDDHLGVRATLERTGAEARLVFEGGLVFVGHQSGESVALGRSAPHEYAGIWTSRETIVLTASSSSWIGTYHYDEIDPSTHAPGTCHIDATVVLSP